jgi:2-polyprenyl-3-methyl-5-hydroxy-6-metoxy-1,4-benzoquinol methylase
VTERGTGIRSHYEQWMSEDSLLGPQGEYFEGSFFANYGYWETDTKGAREACENLMEKLLAMIPDKSGTILDVACGVGATTRHLLRHYAPERITAVDFAEKNVETARRHTPGCTFRQMDATRLDFPSGSFDTVICVEAAFHFQPRSRFLQEAWRVLKPGGRLILADILCERWADSVSRMLHPQNHVKDPQAYAEVLVRAGFDAPEIVDVTEESWVRSSRSITRYLCGLFEEGRIDRKMYNQFMTRRLVSALSTRYYVLAAAPKPTAPREDDGETAGAEETAPPGAEWLGASPGKPDGLRTLVDHARLAGTERAMRLRRMARLEEAWAQMLTREGDRRGARKHAARALLYLEAAKALRRAR